MNSLRKKVQLKKSGKSREDIVELLGKIRSGISGDVAPFSLTSEQSDRLNKTIHQLDELLDELQSGKNKVHSESHPKSESNVSVQKLPDFIRLRHDVMSPLKSIRGAIEVGNIMKVSDDVKQLFFIIEKCSLSLEKQLTDLLDLMQGTIRDSVADRIDFNEIAQGMLKELSYLPGFNTVKFNIVIENNIPFCADSHLVSSVMRNLMSNAVKYKSKCKSPVVDISVNDSDNGVTIEVKDNGIGIAKDELELVFKPYFRTMHKGEGTGMGLNIVSEAVKTLGGTVAVKSSIGKGSSFIVSLPSTNTRLH